MPHNDIGEYLQLRIEEVNARLKAVANVVSQSSSKGDTGEGVLRDIITSFLPVRCEVSNGFVISKASGRFAQSRQIDVLVYERSKSVPLYRDNSIAVVTPDMPIMALESKMVMNKKQLVEAITNIQAVKALRSDITGVIWAYGGMTLKTLKRISHSY